MKNRILWYCIIGTVGSVIGSCGSGIDQSEKMLGRKSQAITIPYHIHNPDVRHHMEPYTNITFQEGDRVYVTATGCVQTGGSGATWKRYVNPLGNNAERLYQGLIWIPGATAGLETIASVIARSPVIVPALPPGADPRQMFLRLGYNDDNYDDNGYYAHDDGNPVQCVGLYGVDIDIVIDRQGLPPTPVCSQYAMDLYWDRTDPNLLPLNPQWTRQCNTFPPNREVFPEAECNRFRLTPGPWTLSLGPTCTSYLPTVDSLDSPLFGLCHAEDEFPGDRRVNGHVNWGFVTYRGRLYWKDQERCDLFGDCDANFNMLTDNGVGASHFNDYLQGQYSVLLEMDSSETIGRTTTPWWSDVFRPFGFPERAFDGKPAIALGLVGFDNVHAAHTELHPLLGLAMHATPAPGDEDVWVFMARRSGNEGMCSQLQHNVELDEMRFLIDRSPYPNPQVGPATAFAKGQPFSTLLNPRDYRVDFTPAGTLVSISLPPPGQVVLGELHIRQCAPRTSCAGVCGIVPDGCGGSLTCDPCPVCEQCGPGDCGRPCPSLTFCDGMRGDPGCGVCYCSG